MFFRCANGSVYDFELTNDQRISREAVATWSLPHKVENRDPVTNGRQQTCAIGCEEKIASAVDGAQQVGELWVSDANICTAALNSPESQSSSSKYRGCGLVMSWRA